ncbi:MAG TPA: M66 family metalloprotease, partial [Polyangiaceae bacterium]|nr:M66 family metalloprotease [Polyangiaceae bacterium]
GPWRPTHLLIGPRSDGKTPNGADTSHPAIVVDENPHCSSADQTAGTCAVHSGYGTMSGVLSTLDTFREANGVSRSSTWYADLATKLGGGLAGGQRGTGDDTDLTMNHELGHAWGFPHWDTAHTDYPYEGVQRNRGGFGDRWALDQNTGLLLSPQCNGLERQSPMQRAGSCVPDGSWFDPYSDYESARLLRMTLGAAEPVSGIVAYAGGTAGGATRAFVLPGEGGRLLQVWSAEGPGFGFHEYDEMTNAFVAYEATEWNRISASEVPVTMFSGAVIRGGDAFFEEPTEYVGNVLEKLDPTDAGDYAVLWDRRSSEFYWAKDLHLRFTSEDGTVFYRIYGGEAVLRADGDHARFAFNLPRELGDRIVKCEVLTRPLGHYAAESRLDESVTPDNFYSQAVVLATWER